MQTINANWMRRDFTINRYRLLLEALLNQGFSFMRIDANHIMRKDAKREVYLRQDVDRLPGNSLAIARMQKEMGIKSTYYFRIVPGSFEPAVIEEIAGMGHEVGYHYEDLSFAWAKLKAQGTGHRTQGEELEKMVADVGIELFKENLDKLRKIAPVKTICMHGSPMSMWDSRLLWKYYDYRDFGIIWEPYFDINFDEALYLTDTGRRWDGRDVAIRDKAESGERRAESENPYKDWKIKPVKYRNIDKGLKEQPATFSNFHSTSDIIKAAEKGQLPDKIMMTFHPQRWTNKPMPWVKELVWQNVKNVGKYFVVKMRDNR